MCFTEPKTNFFVEHPPPNTGVTMIAFVWPTNSSNLTQSKKILCTKFEDNWTEERSLGTLQEQQCVPEYK